MKYDPDLDWKKAQLSTNWAKSNSPHFFFDILPSLRKSFRTPITQDKSIRDMLLGDQAILELVRSMLRAVYLNDVGEACDHWDELQEELYRFLEQYEIRMIIGPHAVIRDLVDLIFGLTFNLSGSRSNQLEFYNILLQSLYGNYDTPKETDFESVWGHQRDTVTFLIEGYATHNQIVEDLKHD